MPIEMYSHFQELGKLSIQTPPEFPLLKKFLHYDPITSDSEDISSIHSRSISDVFREAEIMERKDLLHGPLGEDSDDETEAKIVFCIVHEGFEKISHFKIQYGRSKYKTAVRMNVCRRCTYIIPPCAKCGGRFSLSEMDHPKMIKGGGGIVVTIEDVHFCKGCTIPT